MRSSVVLVVLAMACGVGSDGSDAGDTCNSQTCPSGCCERGACRSGTEPWACGNSGASCQACRGDNVDCVGQTCVQLGGAAGGGAGGGVAAAGGGNSGAGGGTATGGGAANGGGSGVAGGSGGSGGSRHLYCRADADGCYCSYVPVQPSSSVSCTPATVGGSARCCSGLSWPSGANGYCSCYRDPNVCNVSSSLKPETKCN